MVYLKINLKLYILIASLQIVYLPGTCRYCHAGRVWHTLTEKKFSMLQHFDCSSKHLIFRAQNVKLFIRKDSLTSNEYKTETTFKCLTCSAILMNVFKVKSQFDPFECIKWSLTSRIYVYTYFFCSSPKRTVRVSIVSKI